MSKRFTDTSKSRALLDDILQQFSVSEKFVLEYQKQRPMFDWGKKNWDEFLESLSSLNQMHVAFTMSTVWRGRNIYSVLDAYSCIQARKRYLDIGTAYAGFLRAFKEKGFEEVIGIELQEHLATLGKANIDGLDNAQVILGDFVQDDYSYLGTFDVVTCNDVIEHVDDAVLTIHKMAAMVHDGGCLSLEVPNKDFISFVKSDGHFQIFGITQFAKDDSATYYSQALGASRENYLFEMGEMYELDWYIEQLSNNGLSAFIADTHKIADITDVPVLLAELRQSYEEWRTKVKPRIEDLIAEKLIKVVDVYIQQLEYDLSLVNDEASKKRFEDKYLRSFWTILAIKSKPSEIGSSKKDVQIVSVNEELNLMRSSLSWKVTRPLRFIKRFIHNPKQAMSDLYNYFNFKK